MTAPRVLVRLVAVALLVAAAGACTRPPTEPPPTSGQSLVTWDTQGGHCLEPSLCAPVTVTIARNGTWTFHQDTVDRTGQLDAPTLARLTQLVDTATGTLADLPPSTECPENYDGLNIRVVYRTQGRPVAVTNCPRDARPGDLVKDLDGEPAAANALVDYTREVVTGIRQIARPLP